MESILFATKKKTTASQQMTKRAIKPKEYAPTGGPPGTYQGDLVFFEDISRVNRGHKSILTVISANSRFVYAEPLKKKSDTPDAMRRIINNAKSRESIKTLWTDPGTEFTSKKFQDLMKASNIQHQFSGAKNHAPLGRIDRFHLTLRTIFERWFLHTGKNNWVDSLPQIIESYNKRVNSAIGIAPANTTPDHIEQVRLEDKARAMRVANRVDKLNLTPGTDVRHIVNRVGFTKGSAPKWSSTVHEIQERVGVDRFKIKGLQGTYKDYELQAISPLTGSDQAKRSMQSTRSREKERQTQRVERRIHREGIEPRAPSPRRLRPRKK
ncbi:uncharacterized protein [Amphiura filiformis]|uniref:uncharacterized protein n=1 Tax=Amphiura filiformis TaxID=82378 RepID=UPI003B219CB2